MLKKRYNRDNWPLCYRTSCSRVNYVEPHGTTATCKCSPKPTEHQNISYAFGDLLIDVKAFQRARRA